MASETSSSHSDIYANESWCVETTVKRVRKDLASCNRDLDEAIKGMQLMNDLEKTIDAVGGAQFCKFDSERAKQQLELVADLTEKRSELQLQLGRLVNMRAKSKAKTEIQLKASEIAGLRAEVGRMTDEVRRLHAERTTLRSGLHDALTEKDTLERRKSFLETEMVSAQLAIQNLTWDKDQLLVDMTELENTIKQLKDAAKIHSDELFAGEVLGTCYELMFGFIHEEMVRKNAAPNRFKRRSYAELDGAFQHPFYVDPNHYPHASPGEEQAARARMSAIQGELHTLHEILFAWLDH